MTEPCREQSIRDRVRGALLIATVLVALGSHAFAEPAGMTIHLDPATGRLTAPPIGAAGLPRVNAQPTAMSERVGLSPGGGVLLDGIPRMGVAVEVGATGAAVTHCDRAPARGAE